MESVSNLCPICLGYIFRDSYLDRCFHKFCYNCILRWTDVVAKHSHSLSSIKCPLCKTENFSVIHGCDGNYFQQHYINRDCMNSIFFSSAHKIRLQCYYTDPGFVNDKINIWKYWKLRKYLQQNRWLPSWLEREIQSLIQVEDVDIIVSHIVGVIDSFRKSDGEARIYCCPERSRKDFKAAVGDAARPFLVERTERFVDELELFLASGLNVQAYDQVYMQQLDSIAAKTTVANSWVSLPPQILVVLDAHDKIGVINETGDDKIINMMEKGN